MEKMEVTSRLDNKEEEDEEIYLTSDLGEIPEDRRKAEQRNTGEPTKPPFFPMQESLAESVVNRIRNILSFYNGKKISDFENFEFLIFTARFNMLERQTRQRLMDPLARCFSEEIYEDDERLIEEAHKRVHKYQAGEKEQAILQDFRTRAKEEPNTLFLVVGDEAHWGMGKSGSESGSNMPDEPVDSTTRKRKRPKINKSGANSQFINCWNDSFPNVIVLLVTATGFNLKTTETRLVEQDVAVLMPKSIAKTANSSDKAEHRLVDRLKKGRGDQVTDSKTKEVIRDFKEVYSLHNIKWAEGHINKFVQGCVVKLKLPNKLGEEPIWLRKINEMDQNDEDIPNLHKLRITENTTESLELFIQGPTEGDLVIKDSTETYQLVVLGKKDAAGLMKYHIGFTRVGELHLLERNWNVFINFSILTSYGEDVLMLKVHGENVPYTNFLYWREDHVTLDRPPHDLHTSLPMLDREYIFMVEYYKYPDQLRIPEQYLSLNFFYNSMRNQQRDQQLLRGDPFFTEMVRKVQIVKKKSSPKKQVKDDKSDIYDKISQTESQRPSTIDDYLAADYSYFILLIDEMRKCSLKMSSLKEIIYHPEDCLGDFRKIRDARLQQFIQEINKYNDSIRPVTADVFQKVVNFHASNAHEKLTAFGVFDSDLGLEEDDIAFNAVLQCLFFMDSSQLMETFKALQSKHAALHPKDRKNKESDFNQYIMERGFHSVKEEILSESETYRLIDKVIQQESSSGGDGKMVVVRVTKAGKSDCSNDDKKDRHSPGNRFYSTLSLARQVASQEKQFRFEIIRDFDDFRLSDITKDVCRPKYRIFQRLQPHKCEYIDPGTLQRCSAGDAGHPCEDYDPFKPDECVECEHVHREGFLETEQPQICEYVGPTGEKCSISCDSYQACRSLACKKCDHFHKDIQDYNDCNTLPCILILVGKGRLGDTFPRSFCAMDLRLSSDELPYLTRVTQEFGRLCRYAEKPHGDYVEPYAKLPYALIGPALDKCLKEEALDKYPVLYCVFKDKNKVDMQVVVRNSELPDKRTRLSTGIRKDSSSQEKRLAAAASSSDHGNEEKHKYRILLEAEPQIGKTGVYLKTISLLRREICPDAEWEPLLDDDPCSDDEPDNMETTSHKESDPEPAEKWRYPFWKTIKDQKYPKSFLDGKYARTLGSKTVETPATRAQVNVGGRSSNKPEDIPLGVYRAYSKEHDTCALCSQDARYEQLESDVCGARVKISIPYTSSYIDLLESYGLTRSELSGGDSMFSMPMFEDGQQESISHRPPAAERTIQNWIFTPTYRRAYKATVNYRHTMVDEHNRKCYYKHFLVVREEDFQTYQQTWGGSHAILQLPNQMPDCEGDIRSGIGYARLFIQKYAIAHNQHRIFMLDDNISSLHEIKTRDVEGTECVHREGGNLKVENIPLFKVLKYLESQFSNNGSIALSLPKGFKPCKEGATRLQKYTGPASWYGALGIRKQRKGTQRVKEPFKKTNVYSLVLLNLQGLKRKNIEYQPRACREDMILYEQCIDQGLWVCKYNRFLLYKAMLKSHITHDMFCWDDNVKIPKNRRKMKKASRSMELTYKWLKLNYKPSRVKLMKTPENRRVDKRLIALERQMMNHYEEFRKIQDGNCHLLMYTASTLSELYLYFTTTQGIGGYNSHILILPLLLFNQNKVKNKTEIKKRLVDKIFETSERFEVYTSHDIAAYECTFLILQVKGKIRNPQDQDQVPNIQLLQPKIPQTGSGQQRNLARKKIDKEVTSHEESSVRTVTSKSHPKGSDQKYVSEVLDKNGNTEIDTPGGDKMDLSEQLEQCTSSNVMEDMSNQNPLMGRNKDGDCSEQPRSIETPKTSESIVTLNDTIIPELVSEAQPSHNNELEWHEDVLTDQELYMAYGQLNKLHKFDSSQTEVTSTNKLEDITADGCRNQEGDPAANGERSPRFSSHRTVDLDSAFHENDTAVDISANMSDMSSDKPDIYAENPHSPCSPVESDQCEQSDDDESILKPLVPGFQYIQRKMRNYSHNQFDTQAAASYRLDQYRVPGLQGQNLPSPGNKKSESTPRNSKENTNPVDGNLFGKSRSDQQEPIILIDDSDDSDDDESILKSLVPAIMQESASKVLNRRGVPVLQGEIPRHPGNNNKANIPSTDPGTESLVKLSRFTVTRTGNLGFPTEPAPSPKRKRTSKLSLIKKSSQKATNQ